MHIIIRKDPDDGFRRKHSTYWWKLVDGSNVIVESLLTFKYREKARSHAERFLSAIQHADLSKLEIKDEE